MPKASPSQCISATISPAVRLAAMDLPLAAYIDYARNDRCTILRIWEAANRMLSIYNSARSRKSIASVFAEYSVDPRNGRLIAHIDDFIQYISGFKGKYITIQYDEIACLYKDGVFDGAVTKCLKFIDEENPIAQQALVDLSTVVVNRPFIKPKEFKTKKQLKEDWWNLSRIMGDSYMIDVPWC